MSAPTTTATERPNVQEMLVVHKVFRREFALIPLLVRRVAPADTAQAGRIAEHTRLVLDGLHMHHTGEDELLWPLLLERATPSTDLVHRMQAEHARVEELTGRLDELLPRWADGASPEIGSELADTLLDLRETLVGHLDEEEREILPLAAAHLSVAEWNAMGEHGRDAMSRAQLPLMFGAMLEDASPEERQWMLALLPAPIRLLMRTVGARKYRRYITAVRRTG